MTLIVPVMGIVFGLRDLRDDFFTAPAPLRNTHETSIWFAYEVACFALEEQPILDPKIKWLCRWEIWKHIHSTIYIEALTIGKGMLWYVTYYSKCGQKCPYMRVEGWEQSFFIFMKNERSQSFCYCWRRRRIGFPRREAEDYLGILGVYLNSDGYRNRKQWLRWEAEAPTSGFKALGFRRRKQRRDKSGAER